MAHNPFWTTSVDLETIIGLAKPTREINARGESNDSRLAWLVHCGQLNIHPGPQCGRLIPWASDWSLATHEGHPWPARQVKWTAHSREHEGWWWRGQQGCWPPAPKLSESTRWLQRRCPEPGGPRPARSRPRGLSSSPVPHPGEFSLPDCIDLAGGGSGPVGVGDRQSDRCKELWVPVCPWVFREVLGDGTVSPT